MKTQIGIGVAVLAASSFIAGAQNVPAAHAATSVSGTATCVHHSTGKKSAPVGIWVDAGRGAKSGWARLTPSGTSSKFSYSTNGAKNFILHVGCGGTPKKWGKTVYTAPVVGSNVGVKATW